MSRISGKDGDGARLFIWADYPWIMTYVLVRSNRPGSWDLHISNQSTYHTTLLRTARNYRNFRKKIFLHLCSTEWWIGNYTLYNWSILIISVNYSTGDFVHKKLVLRTLNPLTFGVFATEFLSQGPRKRWHLEDKTEVMQVSSIRYFGSHWINSLRMEWRVCSFVTLQGISNLQITGNFLDKLRNNHPCKESST